MNITSFVQRASLVLTLLAAPLAMANQQVVPAAPQHWRIWDRRLPHSTRRMRQPRGGIRAPGGETGLVELIRANDIVLIGFARSLLEDAGIPVLVADEHMSALEGSIGMFGRRLLVPDDHAAQGRRILKDAGLAHELRAP